MALEPGRTLLHYRLVEQIGAGGMGVVWKAVDTQLDRAVAVKVLPEALAGDRERLARFEREARLLAALNHPNIATIHGLHDCEGVTFLAMELVPGEDLARRLAGGALPLEDALDLAAQLAEALEAAHESGVVHRDLKPANIQVTPDGRVKVLDFGLAKGLEATSGAEASLSHSPTVTSVGTQAGVILGTAAYMSPEQARGAVVDKRSDIWAFGCVLYEMLTGCQTFRADSVAETLAAVLKEKPDLESLPADLPPAVARLLRRCLVRDPRQRLRDIGDARIVLDETRSGTTATADAVPRSVPRPGPARWLPWCVAALLALGWGSYWWSRRAPSSVSRPTRSGASGAHLTAVLPDDAPLYLANLDLELMPALSFSPAGDELVYVARAEEFAGARSGAARTLRLRRLDATESEVVRGSENLELPFFSPDGRWIGVFDGSALIKIPAAGGSRAVLADGIGNGIGACWTDGKVIFSHSYVGPLWWVPDSGGEPLALTRLGAHERSHRFPHVAPGGRWVVFTIKATGIHTFDDAEIGIADLADGEHRVLIEGGSYARFVGDYLVYARDGGLLAARFDAERGSIVGGAVPVLEGVITNPVTGAAQYDVSPDGTLAYVAGDFRTGPTRLYAMDRDGGNRRRLAPDHYAVLPRLSPDGTRLVLHGPAAFDEVLRLDLDRGNVTRMTDASINAILPVWLPGGDRIAFTTDRSGQDEIASIPADGGPIETLVAPLGPPIDAYDWSPDGRLLSINYGARASRDIRIYDSATQETTVFLETRFDEGDAVFGPRGDWIVYNSNESGTLEVYALPYPGPGGRVQLSVGGGFFPRLREDGDELYYQTRAGIVAVPLSWNPAPTPGEPRLLFELTADLPLGFDVSADGQRFYVVELDAAVFDAGRIEIVLDWARELETLVRGS